MNLPLNSDGSLYERIATSGTADFLPVSPTTFKSTYGFLLELLTEQHVSATLWVKFPSGTAWQTELKQYCELPDIPRVVYWLSSHKDDLPEETGVSHAHSSHATEAPSQPNDAPELVDPPQDLLPSTQAPLFPVQLTADQLKREYFLLVESDRLCGLVLAYRARSTSITETAHDDGERKHSLQMLLTFDINVIQQVIAGIQQALHTDEENPPHPSLAALQQSWATAFTTPTFQSDPVLLNKLFARQIQRQEELSSRTSYYRKLAETAEVLSLQNQELVTNLRFKDEFLSNVGQELRTPLTNMKTALTLLNSPNLKIQQRQRYLDLLSKECDRQSSIISSLQELVRFDQMVDHATFQALRLREIVPGVVSTFQPIAEEKGIRLACTISDELPPISCVNDWLKQIVINLLDNAIKFTPRGGQVWVRAKQQGDYVQLEFRDNGIGIAPSEVPKVFDRFYRVRQSASEETGGVGMGLTIVQQLLLHCGGSISVKSKLGEGSIFNVLIPIHKSLAETT
jgi:two-component system, OmpR family, phosphate regulon sensor histidine kinase PhoR